MARRKNAAAVALGRKGRKPLRKKSLTKNAERRLEKPKSGPNGGPNQVD